MDNKNLEIAIKAALESGVKILEIYEGVDFGIETKSDNSPLTLADKAAHLKIVEILSTTPFPILSEEGKSIDYPNRKNWNKFWLVDPLDGTKEFINRNGEFTVNIALIENQAPILGVVYVPVTKKLYYADKNGSFLVKDASISKHKHITDHKEKLALPIERSNFVVVGSRSHMSKETIKFINSLNNGGKPMEILSIGSSLKICMVAEGKADIYPRLGSTMEWDTAAGHAIAIFAGKSVNTYPNNTPLIYNKQNLLNPWFVVK